MGAVPFQDAKWSRSGNRVMSPTSTSSRAAPEGPMPCRSSSLVPVAATSSRELLVGGLLPGVDPLQVGDQLGGDPAAGLAGDVAGPDLRQQCLGLGGGQVLLRPAGDQLEQQLVQLGDHPGVVLAQRAAPVDQHPQHRRAARRRPPDAARPSGCRPARRSGRRWRRSCGPDRSRTPASAPTASAAHRRPARRRRAAACATCRPIPLQPSIAQTRSGHRPDVASASRRTRPRRCRTGRHRGRLVGGHHLDRDRPLVRVHPDHDPLDLLSYCCMHPPDRSIRLVVEPGGHRCFEQSNPLLSLSRPAAPGPRRP